MCGLVGVAGYNLFKTDSDALNYLLHLDVLRGNHSTGLGVITIKDNYHMFKEVGIPDNLYKAYPEYFLEGRLCLDSVKSVIGHNRFATQGNIDKESAHPFDMGNIIGAHNGTIYQDSLVDLNGFKEYFIDSQIIFKHINDTNSVQDVWSAADGALALTWWNKEEKTLNFARNKERPLFYVLDSFGNRIYWASESWMLHVGLGRAKVQFKNEDIKSVDVNSHYKIRIDEKKALNKVEIEQSPLEPYVPKAKVYDFRHHNDNNRDVNQSMCFFLDKWIVTGQIRRGKVVQGYFTGFTVFGEEVKIFVEHVDDTVLKVVEKIKDPKWYACWETRKIFSKWSKELQALVYRCKWEDTTLIDEHEMLDEGPAIGFRGEQLSKKEYWKRVEQGCLFCQSLILWRDREKVFWTDREEVLCEKCSKEANMV